MTLTPIPYQTTVAVVIAQTEQAYEFVQGWLVGVFKDADTARGVMQTDQPEWIEDEDYIILADEPVVLPYTHV